MSCTGHPLNRQMTDEEAHRLLQSVFDLFSDLALGVRFYQLLAQMLDRTINPSGPGSNPRRCLNDCLQHGLVYFYSLRLRVCYFYRSQ
jgi:hypothetical protein